MTQNNPIIPGFNPDPSICRVGNDYYLVTSTFQFFPGVPIYHSRDLVNWTQIGNVLSRPEQLKGLERTVVNGGIWAPTIRYHDGKYYVITTMVFSDMPREDFSRWQNFFVSATDPAGPWSDPIFFTYPGYDTSFYFAENQVYVQGSFYHRIRLEVSQSIIDLKTGATTTPHRIWSGTGGFAPEAPHILYKNGWYYLVIAEGGTEFGHSVTMARSKNIDADEKDWEPCPTNPVLTHSDLPDELVQCTGHADLFQDTHGQWNMVFLATRAYQHDHFPMGRESYLVPVNWEGDWPIVERPIKASLNTSTKSVEIHPFGTPEKGWHIEWLWLRFPEKSKYQLISETQCVLTGSSVLLSDSKVSPTLVGLRQRHVKCRVTVDLNNIETVAGLTAYLDCNHYHAIAIQPNNDTLQVEHLTSHEKSNGAVLASNGSVTLAIETNETEFYLEYKDGEKWNRVAAVSSKDLSSGFTGVILGIFSTGDKTAYFSNFTYHVL
ncbi:glycosyl hydrolase [Fennellomyces sp. T-0311]|nr:glycosyl hydrolase [Fennellomyces sp. T-0311]